MGERRFGRFLGAKLELPGTSSYSPYGVCDVSTSEMSWLRRSQSSRTENPSKNYRSVKRVYSTETTVQIYIYYNILYDIYTTTPASRRPMVAPPTLPVSNHRVGRTARVRGSDGGAPYTSDCSMLAAGAVAATMTFSCSLTSAKVGRCAGSMFQERAMMA